MILTIDNHDGAGARDYTVYLDAEALPKIERRLNRPATVRFSLLAQSPDMVVPAANGRVVLLRNDGQKLFTGYLDAALQSEYLGWGEKGPCFRYQLQATGDEALLDRKRLSPRVPFTAKAAGAILRDLASEAAPGAFDLTAVQDGPIVPSYSASPELRWSVHARQVAERARSVYRAHDGGMSFVPVGGITHQLNENDELLSPDELRLFAPKRLVNDVIVQGRTEAREYVKNYFIGDGLTLYFNLSHTPFTRRVRTIFEEEYKGSALDAIRWSKADPAATISVSNGKLQLGGGTGIDGQTLVSLREPVEVGGAQVLQHGDLEITGASDGIVGGLYSDAVLAANCFAGFRVTPSGAQATIRGFVNGAVAGSSINTIAGRRYALTTRLFATEPFRMQQLFHSSTHPTGSGRGGASVASNVRLVLEVHEIDPANPATLQTPSTILYDQVLSSPGFCTYALVNSFNMSGSIAFTRLLRAIECEVRTTVPGQSARTRLTGSIAEGAECLIAPNNQLQFFAQFVPVANETIVVRYRNRGTALTRVKDAASVAANSGSGDDGIRAAERRIIAPPPRTSADSENAALAILDDSTLQAWNGEYQCWSDFLPGGAASDPIPGDAVTVNVPSRSASFSAIVREVEIEVHDLLDDRSRYRLAFANEAFAAVGMASEDAVVRESIDPVIPGSAYIADLPDAQVTAIASTTVTIDVGVAPIAGGGIEVRRTDSGWGAENDRNLIGRFTTQTFSVPRLSRIQTYHLRQYDAASPRKYSRYSTVLHVDYPY